MNAADGTQLQQVTHNTLIDWEPDWATDGSGHIIFQSLRNNVWGIYVMDPNGGNEYPLTTQSDSQPDWSTRGVIAFVSERGNLQRVFTMDRNGGGQIAITPPGNYSNPVWSPDGQRLAYLSQGTLVVDDVPGGGGTPKTVFKGSPEAFAWSPDGRWLELAKFEDQQHTVLRIEVDGQGEVIEFATADDPIDDLKWAPH